MNCYPVHQRTPDERAAVAVRIVELRDKLGLPWIDIGRRVGYRHSDSVRRIYERAKVANRDN